MALAVSTVCQEHVTQISKSELQEEAVRDAQPTKDRRMASVQPQHVALENSWTATVSASLVIVERSQLQMEEAAGGQEDPSCLEMMPRPRQPRVRRKLINTTWTR